MTYDLRFGTTFLPSGNVAGGRVAGWPLEGPITQVFGQLSVTGNLHGGIDIGAPAGTPVRAPAPGRLMRRSSPDFGLFAVIDHPGTPWYSGYAHLGAFAAAEGPVEAGDVVGYCGSTGLAYGAHVHWAVGTNPAFALNFAQLRDPADFVPRPQEHLLETLADIVVRNGIEATAAGDVLDLFPAGTPAATVMLLTGDRALEYARRRGLSLALGITNLNRALLERPPRD
jgi:murein DD-endopeptidase MepM/ murein hydrolase activator NlpD